jgi:hypothetical protein
MPQAAASSVPNLQSVHNPHINFENHQRLDCHVCVRVQTPNNTTQITSGACQVCIPTLPALPGKAQHTMLVVRLLRLASQHSGMLNHWWM